MTNRDTGKGTVGSELQIRFGHTVLTSADFPGLLQRLHTSMAELRQRLPENDWVEIPALSDVSPAMVANASDPASTRLLDWTVYELLLDAAAADSVQWVEIRQLYRALEAINPVDQHVRPWADHMVHLQWSLATITTEADLVAHVKDMMTAKGWTLRKTEKEMKARHHKDWVSNSTLSAWFNGSRLPDNRAGFQALIRTLLPDYLSVAGQEPVKIYMQRYDDLRAEARLDWDIDATTEIVDWEAQYRKSERDRRRAVARIAALEQTVKGQQRWIDQYRDGPFRDVPVHLRTG